MLHLDSLSTQNSHQASNPRLKKLPPNLTILYSQILWFCIYLTRYEAVLETRLCENVPPGTSIKKNKTPVLKKKIESIIPVWQIQILLVTWNTAQNFQLVIVQRCIYHLRMLIYALCEQLEPRGFFHKIESMKFASMIQKSLPGVISSSLLLRFNCEKPCEWSTSTASQSSGPYK